MNARPDMSTGRTGREACALLDLCPERLVVVGFRSWMAGYEHGSIDCWEVAWNLYAGELEPHHARRAFGDLQYWVRAVRASTERPIGCFPHCCRRVCRDECMALSVVSALQHGATDVARTAAHYLTGSRSSDAVSAVTAAAADFSSSLLDAGQQLTEVTPTVVETIATYDNKVKAVPAITH